jgi:AraC family transcriptional regulator of adaptative response/methylated-DNA-[protein]-cysteine methyltransferase
MKVSKNATAFRERVYRVVASIPKGKTMAYGEVARRAGSPRAYRAVGTILKTYDPRKVTIPCHRVIRSDGTIGEYRWGARKKKALLKKEKAIS